MVSALYNAYITRDVAAQPGTDTTTTPPDPNLYTFLNKDHRVLAQVNFTQLTGNSKRNDFQVDTTIEKLSDGWFKIIPKDPMSPGEYALQPVPKVANTFSTTVFDFTIDSKAPNSPEALSSPSS